ncbi:MAG: clostripain-related cysteine peptidase [Elusimicrobiales bacterium]|nr:clostripain-related cysteine peptidase [Elusimicrobiales bacterium]
MIKVDLKLLLASAFLAAPAAALDFDSLPSVKEIASQAKTAEVSVPAPSAPQDARALKEWTIMVFMNGKNNLSSYVISDMNEMEVFGPTANINIVTQAARQKYTPPSNPGGYPGGGYDDYPWGGPNVPHPGWPNPYWGGLPPMLRVSTTRDASTDWTGVRRYLVTKDGENGSLGSTLLQDMGTVDMGDWKQLAEFGKWVKANYPAKKYMLIGWNHGSGWEKSAGLFPVIKGISYDDETNNHISTPQLAQAIREMGGVDIYASDACLMQMAEVAYELKDTAKITVGSEENEPGDGWGYNEFLARVHSNQDNLTPDVMAAAAVQGYKAFYAPKGTATTQSAIRTSGLVKFRQLLDQWADLVMQEDKAMLAEARTAAVGFGGAGSKDLTHFMELVHGKAKSAALKAKTVEVMNQFYNKVLIDNATTGDKFKKAYGLGVYLPGWSFDANYNELAWAKDGKWDEFQQWLTAKDAAPAANTHAMEGNIR